MFFSDIAFIFQWWVFIFLIGIIFLPITSLIFSNFFDRGYIFSKVLGILLISYLVFLLGIFKILFFTSLTIISVIFIFLVINLFVFIITKPLERIDFKKVWKIFFLEEILFLGGLFFWSYIRGQQPDIHGLEKYMDFGFVNSILRADYFPPKDMWFTPFSINYYYFGHLITAVLTKLSGIPSFITYNLMIATLFAFTFVETFSIGANLVAKFKSQNSKVKNTTQNLKILIGGILSAFLITFAGNFHTIYTFFRPYVNDNPRPIWELPLSILTFPNSYWYPNATRFIYNTIHEFPLYSFVVSDLHGHVLDIPVVLLLIATLFSILLSSQNNISEIQNSKFKVQNYNSKFKIFNFKLQFLTFNFKLLTLLLAFLLAIMYMTNVWDSVIYFLLTSFVLIYIHFKQKKINFTFALYLLIIIISAIFFSLPFSLNFKPFASGIGILCAPEFLTNIGKIGPFLFEPQHCQRSPLWQLMILYGFFYFWAISFIFFLLKLKTQNSTPIKSGSKLKTTTQILKFKNWDFIENWKLKIENLLPSDVFILILILLSTLLIIIPEFIYAKDIYPAHYRANTMFKLVYQSFIMLSIASGYIIIRIITIIKSNLTGFKYQSSNWRKNIKFNHLKLVLLIFIGSFGLFLVGIYPYYAINSYYGELKTYKGLNGISYLKNLYPTDYEAILWINKNINGQSVILEAQGDSYTDYARISSNTGLPTILGWTVHEWLWRGTYDIPAPRISDVTTLYETKDVYIARKLIKKYNVSYVFIGDLERQKYINLNEDKFKNLGKLIYKNGLTKIYKITLN
ncbi:hypothetical protein C4559_05960 [Candidatus Microgenomates bacterium]|nr:MAG: hypothetical protein C4559_05960 [Candidatus Microgenomates bacterium]